jgi:hypothetical protein
MMLQMLLGPREFSKLGKLLRHSSYAMRVASGLQLWHVDVARLPQLCAGAAAGWGEEVTLALRRPLVRHPLALDRHNTRNRPPCTRP